jgi:hypothetical protein
MRAMGRSKRLESKAGNIYNAGRWFPRIKRIGHNPQIGTAGHNRDSFGNSFDAPVYG